MKRKSIKTSVFLYIFISLILTIPRTSFAMDKPQAINGTLDLSNWTYHQDGIVKLDGQWEFYWKELLTPEDFNKVDLESENNLIVLPRAWNKYEFDGQELSGKGYATYRLLIKNNSDESLGIKLPRIFTAYKLWVNGELTAWAGQVGTDINQMTPQYLPQIKYINPTSDTIELVIQVSNFRHRSGGILESIKLGTASQISDLYISNLTLELFLFGSLFIMGIYHIILFIFRTKDKSTLFFGIFCLLISMRTLLVGEIYFINLFPSFSWELAHKIQTFAYYLGVPLFTLFLKSVFPEDTSKRINRLILLIGFSFGFIVLLTPARVFNDINTYYQIFTFFVFIYLFYIITIICYRKREGAFLIGMGVLVLILFSINDILFLSTMFADSDDHFLRNFITRGNLSSWGLLIFVFSQSMVLAKKLSRSFYKVELLTEELIELNVSLEDKVIERTLALENSRRELQSAYHAVSRSEKSLQDLIQNISHDLRTPLTGIKGYINAILDGKVKDPEKQNKYLERTNSKIDFLNNMIQELLDLSQLQSRQMKLNIEEVPVRTLIESFTKRFNIDSLRNNRKVEISSISDSQDETLILENIFLMIDIEKLDRVFYNLISNAHKYTTDDDTISISFNFTDDKEKLLVEVSDSGFGISTDELPYIFDRFYMSSNVDKSNSNSTGLGLSIAKEIVNYHRGEIWVTSELGQGSSFFFTLPIYKRLS
ncbi:sensor histidine kinase [Tissierella sp.]|uniref:sensor histidine kinase n=1 Tax=Tissierella sp. TaxID=41274 RepID=UPI0028591185|nr:sensor histidine kinase [Tissierella sp.]MDR7855108.1 sensor histidine kinase [Tissierella sp.]